MEGETIDILGPGSFIRTGKGGNKLVSVIQKVTEGKANAMLAFI